MKSSENAQKDSRSIKKIASGLSFFFHKFLLPAAGYFSLFVIALYLPPDTKMARGKVFILLLAAVGIAGVNLVFYLKRINVYFRVATHFIALLLLLLLVLWLSGYMNTGNWVMILIGFVLAYAVICPILLILRAMKKRKASEEKEESYTPKFK